MSDPSLSSARAPLPPLKLAHGLAFHDLYERPGLLRIDAAFLAALGARDADLAQRLAAARAAPDELAPKALSELLLALALPLEEFLADLFGIGDAVLTLREQHLAQAQLFTCKRQFVQRKAMNRLRPEQAASVNGAALEEGLAQQMGGCFSETGFAALVARWQADEASHGEDLERALDYAAWAAHTPAGRERHRAGVLFRAPARLDPLRLVPLVTEDGGGFRLHRLAHQRHREGFALTDAGTDLTGALDQTHYCIWCHEQGRDSCSHGLRERAVPGEAPPAFKLSAFKVPLAGCPLEEKISEFQKTKSAGLALGALAVITVDNPLVAGTGHRICNDCMKSCIYQKQEPVNIPQAETRTLKDVLELPFGFEIYSLLTRWNPLNIHRPLPLPPSGRRVLVVGMGPAGYTLAHHLMNDGHTVVAVDGLKIEPLPAALGGVLSDGSRYAFEPVADLASLREDLDSRVMAGFGGVAEYGITVRWDKNFLKIIRLLLERRTQFALFGGVRFGGTLDADEAFALGFDHVALALGAGRPTVLDLPNGLARGVRTASDFLMGLQLTGAARAGSVANLTVRLPVVVIGGGLTAIDTATESLAYYPVQVEKFLSRYERLCAARGEKRVRAAWTGAETELAEEFLAHAYALRSERARALAEGRPPALAALVRSWGGVTIAYRKRLIDSPSYTLNHEEVEKALEEGIGFAENLSPLAIEVDAAGAVCALTMRAVADDGSTATVRLPARSVLVAAGTQPNTVLAREDADTFLLDGRYFQACDTEGNPVVPERSAKPAQAQVLLRRRPDGRFLSFFGDLHPSFFGNVVKAMGSAKQGYPLITRMLERLPPACALPADAFLAGLNERWRARVHGVHRLTPNIVEVVIKAPAAAQRFRPGQFYRLQNFETQACTVGDTRLAMEGLALTGAWVDPKAGLVSTIVLEMGGSSDLCALLRPGEPVVLMGPTGTPTETPAGETVLLAGGGLGNAVLFSIGQALRERGSRVLYFAGYKRLVDRYKVAEIEQAADLVVWCCDEATSFAPGRPQDLSYSGNIVAAMLAYARGELGAAPLALNSVERVIAIGSDRMMAAVGAARHGVLAPYLKPEHEALGSINSPMQCMMKEICAQCLQPQRDPATGKVSYVFSCFNQDQRLDSVDFPALAARLSQNSLQEKLTAQWIDHCLRESGMRTAEQ